ncbi:hypothetical protein [Tateyamaria omphalii]|nr:hypothetical protein [Tateyamaria omphalii]
MTWVLVALINRAALQVQFGQVGAPTNVVEALAEDFGSAIVHLTGTWWQ